MMYAMALKQAGHSVLATRYCQYKPYLVILCDLPPMPTRVVPLACHRGGMQHFR